MTDAKKLWILDDQILQLEIAQERAAVMASEISQEYFDLKEDRFKLLYYDKARIESGILFDYVFKLGEQLQDIRKQLREWRRSES